MTTTNKPRGNGLNSTQRLSVRVALATAATIVTLMGAQILALQDQTANRSATAANVGDQTNSTGNTSNTASDSVNSPTIDASTTTNLSNNDTSQQVVISAAPSQPRPVTRSSRR